MRRVQPAHSRPRTPAYAPSAVLREGRVRTPGFPCFTGIQNALPVSLQIRHRICLVTRPRVGLHRPPGVLAKLRNERIALVHQLLPGATAICRSDRVLAEEREGDS